MSMMSVEIRSRILLLMSVLFSVMMVMMMIIIIVIMMIMRIVLDASGSPIGVASFRSLAHGASRREMIPSVRCVPRRVFLVRRLVVYRRVSLLKIELSVGRMLHLRLEVERRRAARGTKREDCRGN